MQFKIGADPELFIRNPNSGAYLSAEGMIPGTKKEPFKVKAGAVQVDGFAAEFNIEPASTEEEFVNNLNTVQAELLALIPGYQLAHEPYAVFDQVYFDSQPAHSKILGCDPDYNAWTGQANEPPQPDQPFRTAAGHIHIGWTDGMDPFAPDHFEDCRAIVKQLDYCLGIQSLVFDPDNRRRSMYGKAGAFRPKPYGVEYRVLSNVWVGNEVLMRWVYEATIRGITDLMAGVDLPEQYGALAQDIIDNNKTDWADWSGIKTGFIDPPRNLKAA